MSFLAPQPPPAWNFSVDSMYDTIHALMNATDKLDDKLAQIKDANVDNFVVPSINFDQGNKITWNQISFLKEIHPDEAIRTASRELSIIITNWSLDVSEREDIYRQYVSIWDKVKDDNEYQLYDLETYNYIEGNMAGYNDSGLSMPADKRAQLKDVKRQISDKGDKFAANLVADKGYITFTEKELQGIPDDILAEYKNITEDGVIKYNLSLSNDDLHPIYNYADDAEARKRLFVTQQTASMSNEQLFIDLLKLKQEQARLMGYEDYASYILADRMAKNVTTVMNFLNDLKDKLRPAAINDLNELKKLKAKDYEQRGLKYDNLIYSWDLSYYANKLLKEQYNIDSKKVQEYFPVDHAIQGMLEIYEELLNLKFIEITDPAKKSVWHEDVRQLSVWKVDDENSPIFLGWLYFDLFPRPGKYGHAANFGLAPSYLKPNHTRGYVVTSLVTNFSKAQGNHTALLKHDEVTTFFHELGHGIHDLVGNGDLASSNGPGSVPWDFVEAPSQMLEYWTWRKDVLKRLTKHYKTGESMSDELIDQLIASKDVNAAYDNMGQIRLSLFDMISHTTKDLNSYNATKLWNELRTELDMLNDTDVQSRGYNTFGHISSGGYAAGYYGYLWSKVFAADMYYSRFEKHPFDSKVGKQYRNTVLSVGGLYDVTDDMTKFLGRPPNNKAFLKSLGINSTDTNVLQTKRNLSRRNIRRRFN